MLLPSVNDLIPASFFQSLPMPRPTPTPVAIAYPDSDGLPMAESDFQRDPLIYAVEALKMHFRNRQDVYVSGNLFLYYRRRCAAAYRPGRLRDIRRP